MFMLIVKARRWVYRGSLFYSFYCLKFYIVKKNFLRKASLIVIYYILEICSVELKSSNTYTQSNNRR